VTTHARFPTLKAGYESFYLRAVDPAAPRSLWLRHTVHKRAGEAAVGSVWVALFDREAGAPVARKQSTPGPEVPEGAWLRVGDSQIGPNHVRGRIAGAEYDLRFDGDEPPLRHLPRDFLYETRLPRTKTESPFPAVRFSGSLSVDGRDVALDAWPGMIGHNWGEQHAERWIWLHGVEFADVPDAWLDLAIGKIKIAGRTTPWVANGAISVGGRRHRLGGPRATLRLKVTESPLRCEFEVDGDGVHLSGHAASPRDHTVVWRYADPDGHEHHAANSSIAALDLVLKPRGGIPLHLRSEHGGTYEIGMRETDHGLPVLPYPDP
jgi:hypothetical protein